MISEIMFPDCPKMLKSIQNNDEDLKNEDDAADIIRPSNVVKWKINAAQYFHCIILSNKLPYLYSIL